MKFEDMVALSSDGTVRSRVRVFLFLLLLQLLTALLGSIGAGLSDGVDDTTCTPFPVFLCRSWTGAVCRSCLPT